MKTHKSFVAVLVALVSMLGMAETATVDGLLWQYSVSEGKATIEKLLTPDVENVVIPSEINNIKVSAIGDCAFEDNETVRTVVISEGVMTIGQCAFYYCCNLMSVTIPGSVSRIRNCAFYGCVKLAAVTIPYGVEHIDDQVFGDCKSLVSVNVPSSVLDIGILAFEFCGNLSSVIIPESVDYIGHGSFRGCENLSVISVNSGNRVYRSLDGVLYNKAGTKLLVCPEGKSGSFQIPSSVICIGHGMDDWHDPTEDTAERGAFEGCAKLTSISIPASVTFIAGTAFGGCNGLKSILVDEDNPWYCDKDGVLYSKDMTTLLCCPGGLEEITIPCSVTDITGDSLFEEGFALDGIALKTIMVDGGNQHYCAEDGVLYAKDKTELICWPRGKSGLITIPFGVTDIGSRAFYDVESGSVTIPPTVINIDSNAFGAWPQFVVNAWRGDLDRVKRMLEDCGVWMDWLSFSEIMPGSEGARWKIGDEIEAWTNGEGVLIVEGKGDMYEFYGDESPSAPWHDFADKINSVVVESGVTSIGSGAFWDCGNLASVRIPEGVSVLGECSFMNCVKLKEVTIPVSMQVVENRAFWGCRGLADVYFSGLQVPAIGAAAFDGCSSDILLHAPSGWEGRSRIISGCQLEVEGEPSKPIVVNLSVTNVAVHYVLNSVQPQFAVPATSDTGFVNIITEVKGGSVAVPETWASEYPNFVSKFGSDFTKALTMKTGKKDGAGNEMLVWQDYVAGTDPTDEKDVFTASITIVDGKVTISYTPELDDERKAMRKYTTWGKTSLMDADWTEVQDGREAEYNFFKVSVEMR